MARPTTSGRKGQSVYPQRVRAYKERHGRCPTARELAADYGVSYERALAALNRDAEAGRIVRAGLGGPKGTAQLWDVPEAEHGNTPQCGEKD